MYPMYLILCPLYGTQGTHCNVPILCHLFWDQIGLLSYGHIVMAGERYSRIVMVGVRYIHIVMAGGDTVTLSWLV